MPKPLREIYLLCVVADHYPALAYQVQEFLTYKAAGPIQPPLVLDVFALDAITEMLSSPLQFLSYIKRRTGYAEKVFSGHELTKPPLVLDVFALDAITEMLSSPLQFLSYIKRRTGYAEKVFSGHELTILSYHLRRNLWIDDKITRVVLGDDIATDLDIAMNARREHLSGKPIPEGILTRFPITTLGRIVERIEATPDPATISLGFALLALSEDAVRKVSANVDRVVTLARRDGKHHDLSADFGKGAGLAVHCNNERFDLAAARLDYHCQKRKYLQKADAWFGICLSPEDGSIRFGVSLEFPWKADAELDAMINGVESSMRKAKQKVGRNAPCPCGSGTKYKTSCPND